DQATYAYFRDRIHTHARQIRAAYDETDPDTSVRLWRELFGSRFPEPLRSSTSSTGPEAGPKFPVPPLITPTRTGRAG
ncbi:SMODS domain-containing nucleotidyltransferase, partial [Streptomyces decoyicus]